MQPKIEIIGDANKCLQYLKWAKQQWTLREGSWQKQLDTCLIYFKRNADSGYILFQTFGTKGLVANPHKTSDSQFVLDATKDPLWIMDRAGWPPLEPSNPEQDKEIQVGNYYVLDKNDNAYSIKVPHHNLVGDIASSVKGYTQYSWTTNVSMEDVYTCYSEYVYSEGEPVFAGTMAPPEAAFKYSLIVGIGLDDKDVLHIAQLVQIPKDYGYWKIERDGSNIGTFFGTFANASEKGVPTLIWKNESAKKKWFIEFLTCDNGLDSEFVTNLNIYRREDASRSTAQWFYKDGTWSQYTSSLPAKFKFDGIQEEGGLKKTRYSQVLDVALVNSKPVVANHVATSLSGVIGTYSEITLPIKSLPSDTITFIPDPTWPAVSTGVNVIATGGCNTITVSLNNLPGFSVSTVESGRDYRVVREDRGTVCNAKIVNGSVVATNGRVTQNLPVYVAGTNTGLTPSIACYPNCDYIYSNSKFYAYAGTPPYTWSATNLTFSVDDANGSSITITGAPTPPIDSKLDCSVTLIDACGRSVTRELQIEGRWCLTSQWFITTEMPCASGIVGELYSTEYSGTTKTLTYVIGFRANQEGSLSTGLTCSAYDGGPCSGPVSGADNPGPWNLRYTYGSDSCDLKPWLIREDLIDSGWKYIENYYAACQYRRCTGATIMQGFGYIKVNTATYTWLPLTQACP